ncbi:thiazole-phosphate synthase [Salsuginibacillus halophilus]|uniref:Thiazole synthase n=1 Tax=Salsuginibacillus halophilus TaxID=517424 RepID=A0A2P8H7X8_9BACI|nr:thiazole synthase [Salsuginibacillus halophilus]PSL42333.1 thiazole-phosphate synthase [Salsuginibacillus halophilus]
MPKDPLVINGTTLSSRFFLGTGRYPNPFVQNEAIQASEAEVLTFAIRRVNLEAPDDDAILQHVTHNNFQFLPNTSGAKTADEAVRIARLAKASGLSDWIKIEVSVNERTLMPDPIETLKATEILAEEGFTVLPYTSDDPVLAKRLEEAGAAAVMPGAAPIGTGLGVLNPYHLSLIIEEAEVPIIIDAGLGSAKDVTEVMELGADGVLMNTPVAKAKDPAQMAEAMKLAIDAGRKSYKAGRIPKKRYATASSTLDHTL